MPLVLDDANRVDMMFCECCVIALANADTSGHDLYCDGEPEPLSTLGDGWALVCLPDTDAEPYFSWLPCDGCGSVLGGDRHDVAGWLA